MSPTKLYQFYNGKIIIKDIYKFLETTELYSLLKYEQSIKMFNKTIAYHWHDGMQMDLFYLDNLRDDNDGVMYILTIINIFTRYGFCEPLMTKSALEVTNKLRIIFNRFGVLPKNVCLDSGSEFKNQYTENFLKTHKINFCLYSNRSQGSLCGEASENISNFNL